MANRLSLDQVDMCAGYITINILYFSSEIRMMMNHWVEWISYGDGKVMPCFDDTIFAQRFGMRVPRHFLFLVGV